MPRARLLKPGFFKNELLAECQPLTRILFEGLWIIADREGRLEDRPKRIKTDVLPYDECDVDALLNELAEKMDPGGNPAFIVRYQVNGVRYIQILNFSRHQNPHKNEAPSTIPAPDLYSTSTVQAPEMHNTNPALTFNLNPLTFNLNPDTESIRAREGNSPVDSVDNVDNFSPDREVARCASSELGQAPDRDVPDHGEDLFARFWEVYPKPLGQAHARKEWDKLIAQGAKAEDIILAASRYAVRCKVNQTLDRFIKMPGNFLADRTFEEFLNIPECPKCHGEGTYIYATVADDGNGNPMELRKKCECMASVPDWQKMLGGR